MRKNLSLIFLLLSLIAAITLWLDYRPVPAIVKVPDMDAAQSPLSKSAPDFTFTDLQGRKGDLAAFKGKIVILHFWATWCAPCVSELPKLLKTAAEMDKDIVVLAVSSDKSPADISKFLKLHTHDIAKNASIYMIWDKDRAITHDLYQTFAYPETILIDRAGMMVRKIPGDADWGAADIKSILHSLANGPNIP